LLLRVLTSMHSTIVLLLHFALLTVIYARPAVDDFEDIPGIPEARLLDWTKFLFAEDGIVTSLTNIAKNPTRISFLSSADRNRKRKFGNFDLNSLFKNFGINLQPQNSGIFDFFDMFDLSKMGLCNRETCGDLYKLFDKIRGSDFVLNLKTLFALLKDEEGLDLLKAMLANPEMLKTFMGGAGNDDKPEIAFVLDKNGKPIANDYDDYYFDGSVQKPTPNAQQDDTLTITRPHQDVALPFAINGTSDEQDELLESITTNDSTFTITTAQENEDEPSKTRQPADYYAFYYDAEPEIQKDDNTIRREAEIAKIDNLSTGQLNITSLDAGLNDGTSVEKVLQNTTTTVV
ncbi:hypothetical protein T11_13838, partial [Trichinella zimbabwensis]